MNKRYSNAVQFDDESCENPIYSSYNNNNNDSYDNISTQSSPYHDNDSISNESKKIRKKRNTYQKIDDETRIKLLDAVQQGDTLKAAAKKYNINYSSAKSILHTFRKEGRILKKSAQERTARKRTKTSNELEMSPIYYNQCQDESYLMQGTTNYKTYHSPDSRNRSEPTSAHFTNYEASPKPMISGMSINSFGGFLKVDSQSQQKPDIKTPASTISFKLDSQRLQRVPSVNTKEVQSGNWQLNVNVHNQNTQSNTKPVVAHNQEPHYEQPHGLKMSNKLKSYESFYMNYANSPLSVVGHMKRQESFGMNAFTDAVANFDGNADYQAAPFDISNFLCSSPPLDFQLNQADNEHFGIGNFALYDNFIGMTEPQEMFSDKPKKSAYIESFKAKMTDAPTGLKGY